MGIFKSFSPKLFQNGFVTIPLNGKVPVSPDWQIWSDDHDAQVSRLQGFCKAHPNGNIGIPLGKLNQIVAVDLDIADEKFLSVVLAQMPLYKIAKKGAKGITVFYEFKDNPARKSTRFIHPKTKEERAIEILSTGNQTVLPPSIHPDTKKAYQWTTDMTLENTSINDMDLNIIDGDALLMWFKDRCLQEGFVDINKAKKLGVEGAKSAGRNDHLKSVVVAMLSRGKSVEACVKEIYRYDLETYGDKSLFNDPKEKMSGKTALEKAQNFVINIKKSLDQAGIDTDQKISGEYPSLENGFFIDVNDNELKPSNWQPDYVGCSSYFKNELKYICTDSWSYKYEDNRYVMTSDLEFQSDILRLLEKKPSPIKPSKSSILNFLHYSKVKCIYDEDNFLSTDGKLNLKNGVLDIKTKKIEQHNPKYFFKYKLTHDYNTSAKCPLWLKALDEIFSTETEIDRESLIIFLQEIFGYTILGGIPFEHKSFLFKGDGRDGKSFVLDILKAMLGPENYSSVSMSNLDKAFSIAGLYGKIANIVTEAPSTINAEAFKTMVAGEEMVGCYKFKDEFRFKSNVRAFYCTNAPIKLNEASFAIFERIIIVPFNRMFTDIERDKSLAPNIIAKEMSGILNWALDGLNNFLLRGHFEIPRICEEQMEEFKKHSDSVFDYIYDCLHVELNKTQPIRVSSFYAAYKVWCEIGKRNAVSKIEFARRMTSILRRDHSRDSAFSDGRYVLTNALDYNDYGRELLGLLKRDYN